MFPEDRALDGGLRVAHFGKRSQGTETEEWTGKWKEKMPIQRYVTELNPKAGENPSRRGEMLAGQSHALLAVPVKRGGRQVAKRSQCAARDEHVRACQDVPQARTWQSQSAGSFELEIIAA